MFVIRSKKVRSLYLWTTNNTRGIYSTARFHQPRKFASLNLAKQFLSSLAIKDRNNSEIIRS